MSKLGEKKNEGWYLSPKLLGGSGWGGPTTQYSGNKMTRFTLQQDGMASLTLFPHCILRACDLSICHFTILSGKKLSKPNPITNFIVLARDTASPTKHPVFWYMNNEQLHQYQETWHIMLFIVKLSIVNAITISSSIMVNDLILCVEWQVGA